MTFLCSPTIGCTSNQAMEMRGHGINSLVNKDNLKINQSGKIGISELITAN